ncbi:unnamed protein product [Prunus brigantina]
MFHSSLLQTSMETMICSVKWSTHELVHLLKGKEMSALVKGWRSNLEVRIEATKKTRESFARAKCSSATSAVDPRWTSPALQGMQAGDLGTFSSLSLEKQREATFHLLKKRVAFAAETIRNPFVVALSSVADLVNAANMEGAEEQVVEEGGAEEDAADEMSANVVDQAGGAAESMADQEDAEEAGN